MPMSSNQNSGWLKVGKDILAGTCGGISVTLVGHPFDTLKIRLQSQPMDRPIYGELHGVWRMAMSDGDVSFLQPAWSTALGRPFSGRGSEASTR